MATTNRPTYVGENWLRYPQGMSFAEQPPADLANDAKLCLGDWEFLICVFAQAQRGRFDNVGLLSELIARSSDVDLQCSAIRILSHVGNRDGRLRIAQYLNHPRYEIRETAISAAFYTCDMNLIDPLLMARRVLSVEESEWVMSTLNSMLEDELNEDHLVLDDGRFESDEEYDTYVRELRDRLAREIGPNTPISNGQTLSVTAAMEVVEALCRTEDVQENGGAISFVYDLIEAMTGTPSTGFFDDGLVPRPLKILATLQEIRESTDIGKYRPGQRYFFGHEVPD